MNKTLLQYFEWHLPNDAKLWQQLAKDAPNLKEQGFTDIWLPPAYKGADGIADHGYGVYDLYDLGEFDQHGGIPTKYGTKDEYLAAINALHQNGLNAIADIVFDHRTGADYPEPVSARPFSSDNRNQSLSDQNTTISAWTGFNFTNRQDKYSNFHWDHTDFSSVSDNNEIYQLDGKNWDFNTDQEHGNYDYLMGSNVDVYNPAVIQELDRWGEWYLDLTHVDGFRLDALKHMNYKFFTHWLTALREKSHQPLWSVGEYWSNNLDALTNYLDESGNLMSLFDVPLHYNLLQASENSPSYDMRQIFDNSLVATRPEHAVTFIDNHDTEPGQPLTSWIAGWFKPLAYALILLRQHGIPCVFYGDLYGIPYYNIDPVGDRLSLLVKARANYAYGEQTDYLNDHNIIGWTRAGDDEHENSGLAVVLSNGNGGAKEMTMGVKFAHQTFIDYLGNYQREVVLDDAGRGNFFCSPGSVSVWVRKA